MKNRAVVLDELIIHGADSNEDSLDNVDLLIGFFNTCRDITKFKISVSKEDHSPLAENLRKFLPIFSNLQELTIIPGGDDTRSNDVFDAITDCCLNLRKLILPCTLANEAEAYYRGSNVLVRYVTD
jgi:hypothetical protein